VRQVESSGEGSDDAAASMIQRFWDSAMALGPLDDETDTQSQMRFAWTSSPELSESSDHRVMQFPHASFLSIFVGLISEATRSQMMSEAHHESVAGSEAVYPSVFSFKLQDRRGRMHRFSCGTLAY
jgi:hypothetical protein